MFVLSFDYIRSVVMEKKIIMMDGKTKNRCAEKLAWSFSLGEQYVGDGDDIAAITWATIGLDIFWSMLIR